MAYDALYVRVYTPLTPFSAATLNFIIYESQILDFSIDPFEGAPDDIFEIAGRKAQLTITDEGAFSAWIHSKQVHPAYPEYLNAVLIVNDNDGNTPHIKGLVKLQNVSSDYDAGTVTITISDALDVYIDQAKKLKYTFTASDTAWSRDSIAGKTLYDLCYKPIRTLALGMSHVTLDYEVVPSFENQPLALPNYGNNISQWSYTQAGVLTVSKFKDVKFVPSESVFYVNLMAIVNVNNQLYRVYSEFYKISKEGNQVIYSNSFTGQYTTPANVVVGVGDLFVDGNTLEYDSTPTVFSLSNPTESASYGTGGDMVTLYFDADTLYTTYPLVLETLHFNQGDLTYAQILNAMLTGNRLTAFAHPVYGLTIRNSAVSNGIVLTGGTVIPDSDIIDQKREGIYADVSNIASALNQCLYADNLIKAIENVYRPELERLSCRLSFSLPDSYFATLAIFDKVVIDSQNYIITSISYPLDGFIDCQAIGEWN